jgi:hypothetical protein
MRTSTAFFAGAGTVLAAIAAGLGGGLLIADMVSPHSSRQEMTRLERRISPEPIPVSNAPSEPVPILPARRRLSRTRMPQQRPPEISSRQRRLTRQLPTRGPRPLRRNRRCPPPRLQATPT